MRFVSEELEREILAVRQNQLLIEELSDDLEERRKKFPRESPDASLDAVISASKRCLSEDEKFRAVVRSELSNRRLFRVCQRLSVKSTSLSRVHGSDQYSWMADRDNY